MTPSPTVAGPAIEALRFAGHEESLRDLYANLLATAMDTETAHRAHPAFVEILKQLSPDEARLLADVARVPAIQLAFINLRAEVIPGDAEQSYRGGTDVLRRFVTLGEQAGCAFPQLSTSYIDNFERLGLIEVDDMAQWTSEGAEEVYTDIEQHPNVRDAVSRIEAMEGRDPKIARGLIRVSALGRQFIEACVDDRSRALTEPDA